MAEPGPSLILPLMRNSQPWPAQGEWTYEDDLRLPDDGNRYEVRTVAAYRLSEDGTRYLELDRGGVDQTVRSSVLPGFQVEVGTLFPRSR